MWRTSRSAAFVAVALVAGSARASVRVSAQVRPQSVLLGETVVLTVTVERRQAITNRGGGLVLGSPYDTFVRPSMPDFDVLSRTQSESTQVLFGGGGAEHVSTVTFRFILRPRKAGRLRIGPARVRVGGHVYSSQPLFVDVRAPGRSAPPPPSFPPPSGSFPPPSGSSPPPSGSSPLLPVPPSGGVTVGPPQAPPANVPGIGVEVDRKEAYVGQQVTVTWVLYHTEPIRELNPVSLPTCQDAVLEDIFQVGPNTRTERKLVGGRIIYATPLYRRAFFPTKVGRVRIDPLVLDVRFAAFRAFGDRQRLRSAPVEIVVKPLPEQGRPAGFPTRPGANVGTYTLSASVDRTSLKTGEAVALTLKAAGVGHPDLLVLPELPKLDGFKVRRGKPKVDVRTSDKIAGSKRVDYVLIAIKPGTWKVPALVLPYFDPADGRYHTAKTRPITFHVSGKAAVSSDSGGAGPNVLVRGIRPIHTDVTLVNRMGPTFYRTRLFLALFLMPLAVLLLAIAVDQVRRRLGEETEAKRWRRTRGEAKRRLKRARELADAGQTREFFAELSRVLSQVLSEKLGIKVSGYTFDELEAKMKELGVEPDLAEAVVRELRNCDFARFAPPAETAQEISDTLDRVRKLVGRISSLSIKEGGA